MISKELIYAIIDVAIANSAENKMNKCRNDNTMQEIKNAQNILSHMRHIITSRQSTG